MHGLQVACGMHAPMQWLHALSGDHQPAGEAPKPAGMRQPGAKR